MSPRLAFALDAAWAAGRSTLSLFNTLDGYQTKADESPVTAADREAERIIRARIASAFPGEAVLGEEEGLTGSGDSRWVVDPIDGTKSFVAGVPLYATLLSYEVEGSPLLGVVYLPALDEMFYAERGEGAFWNGRPCRVSTRDSIKGSLISHAGLKGISQWGFLEGMAMISAEAMATRTWCDAYGHMLVASGRVDAMLDPIVTRWDISAVIPIVEEAGGMATRVDGGSPLDPAHPDGSHQLLSSNGLIHQDLMTVLGS